MIYNVVRKNFCRKPYIKIIIIKNVKQRERIWMAETTNVWNLNGWNFGLDVDPENIRPYLQGNRIYAVSESNTLIRPYIK